MRVYAPEELRKFLEGVDAALGHRTEIVIIGGAAYKRFTLLARGSAVRLIARVIPR